MSQVKHHSVHKLTYLASMFALAFAVGACASTPNTGPGNSKEPPTTAQAKHNKKHDKQAKKKMIKGLAPQKGYMEAHKDVQNPPALLGGPVVVKVQQSKGGVFVALPDKRELDPDVFGTPKMPRAYGGTPGINGVPPMARGQQGGAYTIMKKLSPFGDKHTVMADGRLAMQVVDKTATDAATTEDKVKFKASWKDKQGNTYAVRCCKKVAAHGAEFPTFGGVLTNHLLHGFTRLGTALMPTEFAYMAFWGMGAVAKNGKVLDRPRLIHGMLTEYVRTEGYELANDSEVTPTRKHFHLMVPPMMPNMKEGGFTHKPVKTGFTLPNGKPLPFWHVMFESLEIQAQRGDT